MTVTSDLPGVSGANAPDGQSRQQPLHNKSGNGRGKVYAALDLGTNNCRLLVARPLRADFKIIDAFSRIVRLGEGLSETGRLSEEAMDRAVDALHQCAAKIARKGVTTMRSVATEACRLAENSGDFVARVYEETGIAFDVISPAEEARLAVLGCTALIDKRFEHVVVFDIGGGSTEVIWAKVENGQVVAIENWISLPFGVVTLAESMPRGMEPIGRMNGEYNNLVDRISTELVAFSEAGELREAVKQGKVQFIGTSGTVTTLMSVLLELNHYDRTKIDGEWVTVEEIQGAARDIALMTVDARNEHPCIGPERAELVVPGCAIFEAILSAWPVSELCVADRGIREGVLRALMRRDPLVNSVGTTGGAK